MMLMIRYYLVIKFFILSCIKNIAKFYHLLQNNSIYCLKSNDLYTQEKIS